VCATITADGEGLTPMAEDEPVETTSAATRPTPGEVAALMNVAIATAWAEGVGPAGSRAQDVRRDPQAGSAGTPARRGAR